MKNISHNLTYPGSFMLFWLLCGFTANALADSSLTDNLRIESKRLGYALQYRVYLPEQVGKLKNLPVIYITDGQGYLERGKMHKVLDQEIASGAIQPVVAVFVDSRNPDKLSENRRNSQFMCNKLYALFFANELIPAIQSKFPISPLPSDRVILGMSFGGLNAACFGLMIPQVFPNIAMQSPASDKHVTVISEQFGNQEKLPLKIFFSHGTRKDNTKTSRAFHKVLLQKDYDMTYIQVAQGHDWNNWQPLLDNVLRTFFSNSPP